MGVSVYYNEIDPFAAAWLAELMKAGAIPEGEIDTRSIEDVHADDLSGFRQCHFFAGIGVWAYALRLAGIPDDYPVWTGSCPCQPFSAAGKGKGTADERHLWPAFHHLISVCRPECVFGEQVASKDGLGWLDLVSTDLEVVGYACGAVPFPAAGIGAPHIRQRLYWVADANGGNTSTERQQRGGEQRQQPQDGVAGGVADAAGAGSLPGPHAGIYRGEESAGAWHGEPQRSGDACRMADADDAGSQGRGIGGDGAGQRASGQGGLAGGVADDTTSGRGEERADAARRDGRDRAQGVCSGLGASGGDRRPGQTHGFWRDADWLGCRDGFWRPVEPGTFPLAHGAANRVGRLRGYGNAIVAQQAAAFIEAYFDVTA